MSEPIKRYNMSPWSNESPKEKSVGGYTVQSGDGDIEHKDGIWVKYEDVKSLIDAMKGIEDPEKSVRWIRNILNGLLLRLHNRSEVEEIELCFIRGIINEALALFPNQKEAKSE